MVFDPLQLAKETEEITVHASLRRYYRTSRPGRWYGGIATADCIGCNLRCVFCWSGAARDNPGGLGRFCSPEQIFSSLTACAKKFGYKQVRVSGNEPTIARNHLLKLLELVDQTKYGFILETNGTLIGQDAEFARKLSTFKRLHVRVSIKGTNKQEFATLTGATPEAFTLQLKALENLLNAGVTTHPAVMLSFSLKENLHKLANQLRQIDPRLVQNIEEEYVILYPHVVKRLVKAGFTPRIAYEPNKVPKELV
jgi:uncharacterized Fe-S cluster-containing radical SAM superfamily protein